MASRGARPDSPRYRPRPLRWPATTTRKRLGLGFGAMVAGFSETRRTPGPAAGCNKPATSCAEEAVEVVRNHEDGTRLDGWCRRPAALRSHRYRVPRGSRPGSGRARSMSVEGRNSNEPQERQGPGVPARSFGSGSVRPRRTRRLRGRFEGDSADGPQGPPAQENGHGAPMPTGSPADSDASVMSSRAPGW